MAAVEIHVIRDENRRMRHQLACVVLFDATEMDGAFFPKGAKGNQIRKVVVVEVMDGTINTVLQLGVATVELELWWVHAEHISKVCGVGGKHQGCQAFHPHAHELGNCITCSHICQLIQRGCQDYDASEYQHCLQENDRANYHKEITRPTVCT